MREKYFLLRKNTIKKVINAQTNFMIIWYNEFPDKKHCLLFILFILIYFILFYLLMATRWKQPLESDRKTDI